MSQTRQRQQRPRRERKPREEEVWIPKTKLGKKVASENALGVLICGTGIGMSIAANKVKGVRAALVYQEDTAKLAKEHNNANVLCLGGRITDFEKAKKILSSFLSASFQGDRHERRVKKIDAIK